jgi:hypothetical protein
MTFMDIDTVIFINIDIFRFEFTSVYYVQIMRNCKIRKTLLALEPIEFEFEKRNNSDLNQIGITIGVH